MLCAAYGLIVVETPAAYSSRFCSLSGQPGFRAEELTKDAFAKDFFWRRELEHARKEPDSTKAKALLAVNEAFEALPEGSKKTYLLPRPGGGVFVASGGGVPRNADLNAAVNLALRAIAAPDVFDIHSRVRSEWKNSVYVTRETRNRFGPKQVEILVADLKSAEGEEAPEALEARPNFFFLPTADKFNPGFDHAKISHEKAANLRCHSGRAIWKTVNDGAWARVLEINGVSTR